MNTIFTEDGTLQRTDGGGRLLNRCTIVVGGDGAHADFGGGTLNILRKLESPADTFKVVKSYTAVNVEPDVIDGIGDKEIRAELTGSTTPDLYVEIGQA